MNDHYRWIRLALYFSLLFNSSLFSDDSSHVKKEESASKPKKKEEESGKHKEEESAKHKGSSSSTRVALSPFWDNGLLLQSCDKAFSVRIGGRFNFDWGWVRQDARNKNPIIGFGVIPAGVEFRRARIELTGTMYRDFNYSLQVDFGGGAIAFKDIYLSWNSHTFFGTIIAGHFFERFGLEMVTSDKCNFYLEYALPVQAFAPQREDGIAFYNSICDRFTYEVGIFRPTGDSLTVFQGNSGYSLTGRFTGLPWYVNGGVGLVHLGVAYSIRYPQGGVASFSTTPEWHNSSVKFVNTGSLSEIDRFSLVGGEFAVLVGPLSLQAEYLTALLSYESPSLKGKCFDGWYVAGSWFLTGEHRTYDVKRGIFCRPFPRHNFNPWCCGFGAIELIGRVSNVDLNDKTTHGGEETNVDLGVNWYFNPNSRLMTNWIHAMTQGPDRGNGDFFLIRLQFDF